MVRARKRHPLPLLSNLGNIREMNMHLTQRLGGTPLALAAVLAAPAFAVPLVNGDFSDPVPLAGWTETGAAITEPTGDFAQLETEGSHQRILEQGFTLVSVPAVLSFDFAFSTDTTGPVVGFSDAFSASVITATGAYLDILFVDLNGAVPDPSDGLGGFVAIDVTLDPAVSIPGFLAFAGGTTWSGRIGVVLPAPVQGQVVALYFDLMEQPDGATTRAALDNVRQYPVQTPVPGILALPQGGTGCLPVPNVWSVAGRRHEPKIPGGADAPPARTDLGPAQHRRPNQCERA